MNNPMELTGKHILITGASGGIGSATALTASKLGAKLSLVGRNEEKLQAVMAALAGEGHHYYCCDLEKPENIEQLITRVVADKGAIDGLANCMGIAQNRAIKMTNPDFLSQVFRVNFFPFVELVRIITKKKNSRDGASLVGISSVAAFKGNKAQGAYAASKAAIDAVIRPMAKEFAQRGIRVNNVAFGMIDTDMYRYYLSAGGTDEGLENQYLGVGKPEDAANVLCFLLSDASKFITGTTIIADGGFLS